MDVSVGLGLYHGPREIIEEIVAGRGGRPQVQRPLFGSVVRQPQLSHPGLFRSDRVLLEDVAASVSDYVHPYHYNVSQNLLLDLGGDPQALEEEELGHDGRLLEDDLNDHDRGGALGVLYDGDLLDILADPPYVLLLALLVLVEFFHHREI